MLTTSSAVVFNLLLAAVSYFLLVSMALSAIVFGISLSRLYQTIL